MRSRRKSAREHLRITADGRCVPATYAEPETHTYQQKSLKINMRWRAPGAAPSHAPHCRFLAWGKATREPARRHCWRRLHHMAWHLQSPWLAKQTCDGGGGVDATQSCYTAPPVPEKWPLLLVDTPPPPSERERCNSRMAR